MNQKTFRQLLSGTDATAGAKALRVLLRLVSGPYAATVWGRNVLYDRGLLKTAAAAVPVISVGNITTGGTGKTPLVIWLCRMLESKGLRPAILTRGYKSEQEKLSDEPALLAKACPNTAVIVNPDRAAGAAKAVARHAADVLVLDDGFQHRRLKRDLNILTLDATCPFGYGHILPAGLLREPLSGVRRADVIVITRYDQVEPMTIERLQERLAVLATGVPVVKATHRHTRAVMFGEKEIPLASLAGKRAFVFCGIGNPEVFFAHVRQNGIEVAGTRIFNDHHPYTQDEIKALAAEAAACGAEWLLCTQKDWVKTALLHTNNTPITPAYLAMELDFIDGVDILKARIDEVVEKVEV
ncbi:MAG: tetraacyldisaccharide 4'-kinase [Phycisphaerae bacterium]|nr:tetraacyldisaccharide 4'-kinase [Phycisphaerae bacterium]